MNIKVDTTNYRSSHGNSPRGTGMWMFLRYFGMEEEVVASGFGTYTEIKAKAVAKAKEMGITEIHVGS